MENDTALSAPRVEIIYELVTPGKKTKYYDCHGERIEVVFEDGKAFTVNECPDGTPSGKTIKVLSEEVRIVSTTLQDLRDVREGRSSSLDN
jgi:hypothetical protein